MRTLLLDQSSSCIGFALLDKGQLVDGGHGVITPTKMTDKTPARLREMMLDLQTLVRQFQPDEIVIEWHHYHGMQNWQTIEPVAGITTVCNMVAAGNSIPVYRVRNQRWQCACGAKGKDSEAIKKDVRRIVGPYWGVPDSEIKSYDHSDALGMAACWKMLAEDLREEWRQVFKRKGKRK